MRNWKRKGESREKKEANRGSVLLHAVFAEPHDKMCNCAAKLDNATTDKEKHWQRNRITLALPR